MDVARPYAAVAPTLDGDVLVVLARTTRPLTGREISRLVRRGSQQGVSVALRRLTAQGLVERQEAGRALLYTLNREHLAAPAVVILAGIQDELIRRVAETVGTWELKPLHASLFGSAARRDGGIDSDIDLFIVRPHDIDEADPDWRRQVDELVVRIRQWTGNDVAAAEIDEREIPRLKRERPQIVDDLGSDSITVAGPTPAELLGPAS